MSETGSQSAHRRRILVVGLVAALIAAVPAAGASAAPDDPGGQGVAAAAAGLPETVGADALPTWQINGVVWSEAIVGNTVYVTGKFTKARPPGVARGGAGEVDAGNLFAFDLRTGERIASFSHTLNGQGLVVRASPDGSRIYVGGDFTTVDGVARSHMAAFDTATQRLVDGFRPAVGGQVRALAVSKDTVYVGGNFESAGGLADIRSLASFAVADGADRSWHPIVGGVSPVVYSMTLVPAGDAIVLGGGFDQLNDTTATGMGKIGVDGTVRPWAASERIKTSGLRGAITSVKTDGKSIFGTGMSYSDPAARFEGTFSADPDDGSIIWVNDCLGDSYDTAAMDGVVYAVHHNHDCRTIGEFGDTVPRSRWMKATAIPDQVRGVISEVDEYVWDFRGLGYAGLLQWYPDLAFGTATTSGQAAWTVAAANGYVVLGGEFPKVNGAAQEGLTRFGLPSIGPHLSGPVVDAASTPVATARTGGVYVDWTAATDADDATLTYNLLRDGSVVGSLRADSVFWHRPGLVLVDPGGKAGDRYAVRVSDGDGNTVTTATSEPATQAPADSAYGTVVLADGASHYWPLDGTGADRLDRAGGDTVSGGVIAAGQGVAGDALDASADSVLTSRATNRTTAATSVEAWVRTDSAGGGRIVGRGSNADGSSDYRTDTVLYLTDSGRPAFATTPDKPKATTALTGPSSVADGRWHHLVGTVGDGATTLWVDGVRVAESATANQAQFAGYWRLLGDAKTMLPDAPAAASVTGQVDEVAVYPFVLAGAAIQRHHALGTGAPAPDTDAVRDSFSRAVDGGWGTADSGQKWTVTGLTSRWSVADGVGRYTAGAGNGTPAVLDGVRTVDADVNLLIGADKAPTGGGQFYSVVSRHLDLDNGYSAKLKLTADGVTGYLVREVDGVSTNLASAALPEVTTGAGSRIRVRVQTVGTTPTTVRLKAWRDGSAEPSGWQVTASDDTAALQRAGAVALHPYLAGSATNAPVMLWADDLTVGATNAENTAPSAAFTVGPTRLDTTFDATSSTDPDGRVVAYAWDFGDGQSATGVRATHRYAEPGTYRVRLTVTDDAGASDTADATVTDTTAARDQFGRSGTGWGSADLGGTWSTRGGSGWAVADGVGLHRDAPGQGATATLPLDLADSEAQVTITTDSTPSGSGQYLSLVSRSTAGSDYRTKVRLTATGVVQVYLCRTVDGVETTLASTTVPGLAYRPGVRLVVRMQVAGTGPVAVRASVWAEGQQEPDAWTVTATDDAQGTPKSGATSLVSYVSGSAASGTTFTVDDLWVGQPQP